jgi:hypothetical protein
MNRRYNRKLAVENLESRCLLTVVARLVDWPVENTLLIKGDEAGNAVELSGDGAEITVIGDGEDLGPFADADVDLILVKSGEGNDTVNIEAGSTLNADVVIRTGKGDDVVDLGPLAAGAVDLILVRTGAGNDTVNAELGCTPDADVLIRTGAGDDSVNVSSLAEAAAELLSVRTSIGDDTVIVEPGSAFNADLDIRTGMGDDWVSNFIGDRNDESVTVNGNLHIRTGQGDDKVLSKSNSGVLWFTHWDVSGNMVIRTGLGDDDAALQGTASNFFLNLGPGDDGGGIGVYVTGYAVVRGGWGEDFFWVVENYINPDPDKLIIRGVEDIRYMTWP